ncbi:hypothetical protein RRG08_030789 [Elysia crispata]|uniref:Uncharacterized protein n=1 Tax=Elysia crispata TaxID=231223 RepID=A0AAE0YFG8_9GAST|nr:hypothetical protein RRG08_030789 [Elysia crispata]
MTHKVCRILENSDDQSDRSDDRQYRLTPKIKGICSDNQRATIAVEFEPIKLCVKWFTCVLISHSASPVLLGQRQQVERYREIQLAGVNGMSNSTELVLIVFVFLMNFKCLSGRLFACLPVCHGSRCKLVLFVLLRDKAVTQVASAGIAVRVWGRDLYLDPGLLSADGARFSSSAARDSLLTAAFTSWRNLSSGRKEEDEERKSRDIIVGPQAQEQILRRGNTEDKTMVRQGKKKFRLRNKRYCDILVKGVGWSFRYR